MIPVTQHNARIGLPVKGFIKRESKDLDTYTAVIGCIHNNKLFFKKVSHNYMEANGTPCHEHKTFWVCYKKDDETFGANSSQGDLYIQYYLRHPKLLTP